MRKSSSSFVNLQMITKKDTPTEQKNYDHTGTYEINRDGSIKRIGMGLNLSNE